jgi:hypothetical protein
VIELDRLQYAKQIPPGLDVQDVVLANAFEVLTCVLNLVVCQLSYFGTAKRAGKVVAKAGVFFLIQRLNAVARTLASVFMEIQKKYQNTKGDLGKSLTRFNDSLWDAGLVIGIG